MVISILSAGVCMAASDMKPAAVRVNTEARTLGMYPGRLETVYVSEGVATEINTTGDEQTMGAFYGGEDEHHPLLSTRVLEKDHHQVIIEPKVPGLSTNLAILTDHQGHYNLLLVPSTAAHPADSVIYLQPATDKDKARQSMAPEFVPADVANEWKRKAQEQDQHIIELLTSVNATQEKLLLATIEQRKEKQEAEDSPWRDNYQFDHLKEPFRVLRIQTNGTITKIYTDHGKDGAAYAMKAGKKRKREHTMLNKDFDSATGIWTIYADVEDGTLVLGDKSLHFQRTKRS